MKRKCVVGNVKRRRVSPSEAKAPAFAGIWVVPRSIYFVPFGDGVFLFSKEGFYDRSRLYNEIDRGNDTRAKI